MTEWFDNPHGLRCPECAAVLVEQGTAHKVLERDDPVVVTQPPHKCPNGHDLPDDATLVAWRDANGYRPG